MEIQNIDIIMGDKMENKTSTVNLVITASMLDKELEIKLAKYNECVRELNERFPILEKGTDFKEKKLVYKNYDRRNKS